MELSHARIPGPGAPAGQRTAQGGQLLYCSIAQWGGGCGGVYGLAGLLLLAHSKSVDPRYLTLMGSGFDGPYHHLTGAPPLAIGGEEEVEDRGRWRHARRVHPARTQMGPSI
jgi:hypothetical protein